MESNLAGLEEEGWVSTLVVDTVTKTHGGECAANLLLKERQLDLRACPCMGLARAGLEAPSVQDAQRDSPPFFYLKLHKVRLGKVRHHKVTKDVRPPLP